MQKKEIGILWWLIGFAMWSILWAFVCISAERAAAEYTVDKTTGEVTFVYLTAPPK